MARCRGLLHGRLGLAQRAGAGEQCLASEPPELRFERRSPGLFHHLQPSDDRYKCCFGLLPARPITRSQVELMECDNIASPGARLCQPGDDAAIAGGNTSPDQPWSRART
jgi:hypothetical protein